MSDPDRTPHGLGSWEQLCQDADLDAVGAGWGMPLWSAAHPNDTPPSQQESNQ